MSVLFTGLKQQSLRIEIIKLFSIKLKAHDKLILLLLALGQSKTYATLDEEEKDKTKTILFIMDRFSISLEGYQELTQTQPALPTTYLVESCAKELDSKWKVKRTPVVAQGAELPLKLLLE